MVYIYILFFGLDESGAFFGFCVADSDSGVTVLFYGGMGSLVLVGCVVGGGLAGDLVGI